MEMKEKRQKKTALPTIDQIEAERKRYRWHKAYAKALRGTISVLTYMAAVAALIATLVLPVLQIEGTSMEPTLVNGDIVLLVKTKTLGRGDICGFAWNNKILIKRVIGIPGDWIEIDTDGTVYRNGEKLEEPYAQQIAFGECDLEFPFQVPQEEYFVLGDNRNNSEDSRFGAVGNIHKKDIDGRAWLRIWPFDQFGILEHQ